MGSSIWDLTRAIDAEYKTELYRHATEVRTTNLVAEHVHTWSLKTGECGFCGVTKPV